MRETLDLPPPAEDLDFTPSELFRFFFQIGRWTEESFSTDFQTYTRGKLISTVTINKWKNRDVIPTRYSGPLFKMIEDQFEPDVAKDWIAAFERVWATHVARPKKSTQNSTPDSFSDAICRQHRAWIETRYSENLNGEPFSAKDIYVPLQFVECGGDSQTLYDIEDLLTPLTSNEAALKKLDWTFICGGPGSGKSMAAIQLAQDLAKIDIFPIYMRGTHLSDIPIDIQNRNQHVIDSFSIKSFLKHFRASSQKTACLILDGIDEISAAASSGAVSLAQIQTDLNSELNICRAHGKNLHIFAFGRAAHIEFAISKIASETSRRFEMLGLDGRYQQDPEMLPVGRDIRAEWWQKYLRAIGKKADPTLPDFLSIEYDEYSDFGSDPLLTYLICRTALASNETSPDDTLPHEAVNAVTYAKNRNEIYQNIVSHNYARISAQSGQGLKLSQYQSVLQHIGLANWHQGEGRVVSMQKVRDSIFDENTEAAFQSFLHPLPEMLMTAFYYRMSQDEETLDQSVVEFTHKTFSEYLVSTLIFDRFRDLITAFGTKQSLDEALMNWSQLASAGEHKPTLADFCQAEAALRYESFSHLNWDDALILINNHLNIEAQNIHGIDAISAHQRAASLLFFIWSCLNLERHKRTDSLFTLSDKPEGFSAFKLKQIQFTNRHNFEANLLTEPRLQMQTFLTPSLSALSLASADMSQISFSLGHMESVSGSQLNFAMTHWSHVKISESEFHKSVFSHSIVHGNRWLNTKFSNCLFQADKINLTSFTNCSIKETVFSQCHLSEVDFISVDMEGVIFDRCIFTNCHFGTPAGSSRNTAVTFRHCTFLELKTDIQKNGAFIFEACIFQTGEPQKDSLNKNIVLEGQIGKLLN